MVHIKIKADLTLWTHLILRRGSITLAFFTFSWHSLGPCMGKGDTVSFFSLRLPFEMDAWSKASPGADCVHTLSSPHLKFLLFFYVHTAATGNLSIWSLKPIIFYYLCEGTNLHIKSLNCICVEDNRTLWDICFKMCKKLSSTFGSVDCAKLFCLLSLTEHCNPVPFWSSNMGPEERKFNLVEKTWALKSERLGFWCCLCYLYHKLISDKED